MTDQLFSPDYATPIDTRTQVDRLPGIDAPCHCGRDRCRWPLDPDCWPDNHPDDKEDA